MVCLLLFYIAHSTSHGNKVNLLKQAYKLENAIPDADQNPLTSTSSSTPNSETFKLISKELLKSLEQVKAQYERYPYPPVPMLALPRRGQGRSLAYETGMLLAGQTGRRLHQNKRILVAGAGTLEALVVAQTHPYAKEIVAVDLSSASISCLKRRAAWSRMNDFCRLRWGRRLGALPSMRFEVADLMSWQPAEAFDYIVASNMLHHVEAPAALLQRLSPQHIHPGAGRQPRAGRDRLPLHGDLDARPGDTHLHPDGRRGCYLDWPGTLY